ncbi:sigma E protease regulator RseP [Aliidiomarina halalkaliphila]|uniref:Zinc metalloprotease n=1 Tax=Aliidiomarina halalkaliphila TaxID=2593535 RepID=A0A552X3N0_9GAMM|nr:sigma E protease regulator RseP [Aliidiomarina halalkaliphila]TRW49576.1 sigma E protease regulator RseP [Aliidiomarina halalkaliphila]
MEQFLWSIGAFIVALGLVVTFHEFGHFWVARRCGVKVVTFSIGFGKPLFKWHGKDGTQYQVAAIPLGGYVRMLDHEVDPVTEQEMAGSFRAKPVKQRFAIVLAGPVANFIFAIAALWLMLMIGMPAVKPIIGAVAPESIAAQAGIQPGSEIVAIDQRRVQDWQDVNLALVRRMGSEATVFTVMEPSGVRRDVPVSLQDWQFDPDRESTIGSLGLDVYRPQIRSTIAQIDPDSPAGRSDLRVGDKIIGFDGTQSANWEQIRSFIADHAGERVTFQVERNGNVRTLDVLVGEIDGRGYLGIVPEVEAYPEEYRFTLQYGPIEALQGGVARTWNLMGLTVNMVGKLVTGNVSVKNLSGPVGIAQGAGAHASYGLVYFLSFLALISVSLGILNLLPIPMLDGGHLVFYVIEWIRGKPVSERVQEVSFRAGLLLLMVLLSVTLFNDLGRLFS